MGRAEEKSRTHAAECEELYAAACRLPEAAQEKLAARLLPADLKEELAARPWPQETREKLGLAVPATIYVQDPLVAEQNPELGLQDLALDWEAGLTDGPTSARVAVVDYDGDQDKLEKPARWDRARWCFVGPDGQPIGRERYQSPQFHQVNVWAIVQRTLTFFEEAHALGRPVPWAFEGQRLIVVPHAGYGENAFYDRNSKSLQFYYCGPSEQERVYTCLSHDIVAHETGHAILDGMRPRYNECSSLQTAAFHEFVADLTAILSALRNNDVRHVLSEATKGDLSKAQFIANVADQFGKYVTGREFIRTAINNWKMKDVTDEQSAHDCSQVLTGAMFDVMVRMAANYMEVRKKAPGEALWYTVDRFRRVALQPLDYCPPVDVQFEDYAEAFLRRDQLTNPRDPFGYRKIMRDVFKKRQIPHPTDEEEPDPPAFRRYDVGYISSSRTAAYHFLHENRGALRIPQEQDLAVDVYSASKLRRGWRRLPREIILQYVWREDVELDERRFGPLKGQTVALLCGGTLVFDECGNFLHWARKPGTQVAKDREEGERRRQQLLDCIASQAERGMLGLTDAAEMDRLGMWTPVVGRRVDGGLRLEMAPRLHSRHGAV